METKISEGFAGFPSVSQVNLCDHGHETLEIVKLLPIGNGYLHGNIIVCLKHYEEEIAFRREMKNDFQPKWKELKKYDGR